MILNQFLVGQRQGPAILILRRLIFGGDDRSLGRARIGCLVLEEIVRQDQRIPFWNWLKGVDPILEVPGCKIRIRLLSAIERALGMLLL